MPKIEARSEVFVREIVVDAASRDSRRTRSRLSSNGRRFPARNHAARLRSRVTRTVECLSTKITIAEYHRYACTRANPFASCRRFPRRYYLQRDAGIKFPMRTLPARVPLRHDSAAASEMSPFSASIV